MSRGGLHWRLTIMVAGATTVVVLVLVVSFSVLLSVMIERRTIAAVTTEAEKVAMTASLMRDSDDRRQLRNFGTRRVDGTTVLLPDGKLVGDFTTDEAGLTRAREDGAYTDRIGGNAVIYVPQTSIDGSGVVVVRMVVSSEELHRGAGKATAGFALLGLGLIVLATAAAHALGTRVISVPIMRLVDAAEALREGQLDTRTPERGPVEIMALARSLNRLGAKIKDLLVLERESVADLSHRLRTPITALRLDTDSIPDPEVAGRFRRHVSHLERTVDAVMREVRRPSRTTGPGRCDVAQVVADRVAFWSALADEQRRYLRVHLPKGPAWARIDRRELADVVDALIDNIFAYTPEGVSMEVSVELRKSRHVALLVEDGGPGLPTDHVVRRGSSGGGSSGLGLDIVRRTAIASGGGLELGRSRLGGAQITVLFGVAEPERPKRFGPERLRRDRAGRGSGNRRGRRGPARTLVGGRG
jgi:signal transduction histidine kinase